MKFDLEDLNPGTWFDLPNRGRICIRLCAGDDLKRIQKITRKKKEKFKYGRRFEYEIVNEPLEDEMIWDFCIIDWEDIVDQKNDPIECTKDNKLLLMNKSVTFANVVANCLDQLTEATEEEKEEEEKNSLSSQGG